MDKHKTSQQEQDKRRHKRKDVVKDVVKHLKTLLVKKDKGGVMCHFLFALVS